MPNRFNQPNRAKTAEQTTLISKYAEKHFASTVRVGTKAHCATKYKHTPRIEPKSKKPVLIRISQENLSKARKNTEKYCVSRETLNILSINFSQTHRVSYCEKQELQKKTVNNIGFTVAMHDRKGKRPDKM